MNVIVIGRNLPIKLNKKINSLTFTKNYFNVDLEDYNVVIFADHVKKFKKEKIKNLKEIIQSRILSGNFIEFIVVLIGEKFGELDEKTFRWNTSLVNPDCDKLVNYIKKLDLPNSIVDCKHKYFINVMEYEEDNEISVLHLKLTDYSFIEELWLYERKSELKSHINKFLETYFSFGKYLSYVIDFHQAGYIQDISEHIIASLTETDYSWWKNGKILMAVRDFIKKDSEAKTLEPKAGKDIYANLLKELL